MKRATAETVVDPKTGDEKTRYWIWKKGRRLYMDSEPGPKTEANRRRRKTRL